MGAGQPVPLREAPAAVRGGARGAAHPARRLSGDPSGSGPLPLRPQRQAVPRISRRSAVQPLELRRDGPGGLREGPRDRRRRRIPQADARLRADLGALLLGERAAGVAGDSRTCQGGGLLQLLDAEGGLPQGGRRGAGGAARLLRRHPRPGRSAAHAHSRGGPRTGRPLVLPPPRAGGDVRRRRGDRRGDVGGEGVEVRANRLLSPRTVLPSEASPSVPLHFVEREGPKINVYRIRHVSPSPLCGEGPGGEDSEGRPPQCGTTASGAFFFSAVSLTTPTFPSSQAARWAFCCGVASGRASSFQRSLGFSPKVTGRRVRRSRRATSRVAFSPERYTLSLPSSPSGGTRKSSMARISSPTFTPAS